MDKAKIGLALKMARSIKFMNVSEFARQTGISRAMIYYYEKGQVDIPATKLIKICEVLGISTKEILGR